MPMVSLASFPGSGNTWTRHLLEQLTGIQTGTIFEGVVADTFSGESICPTNNSVFLVKTHKIGAIAGRVRKFCPTHQTLQFEKAVYILRNPFNAFFSTYNLVRVGKTGSVSMDSIKNDAHFENFATSRARSWSDHVMYWLKDFKEPVHVLVYERLKTAYM
ncbi:WSCD family member CG9164-like [Mya arenaria]|uniref:WSCD family member CG9164-like n=1 Tax=Mya arenaria TaxID=6604 RepID=UPI0022E66475|nr:WSCD family member CG9164-like [Mya arenaria]